MQRSLLAVLLAFPSLAYSQAIPFEQRPPVISLTASAAYIYGQPQAGHDHSLLGWSVVPEINLTNHIGLQVDCASFYMQSANPGQKRLIRAAGPRYSFLLTRFRTMAFVFGEGGEMRVTEKGSVFRDWDPVGIVGVGFKRRIFRNVDLTVVPAEFLGQARDDGYWSNNYAARAGFTYNFYRR
jgi:hypothetical protein